MEVPIPYELAAGISVPAAVLVGSQTTFLITPFRRAALMLQTQALNPNISPKQRYPGPLAVLVRTNLEQGFRGHWRGLGTRFLTLAPDFIVMRQITRFYEEAHANESYTKARCAAFLMGGVVGYTFNFVEMSYTRLCTDPGLGVRGARWTGMLNMFSSLVLRDGTGGRVVSRGGIPATLHGGILRLVQFELMYRWAKNEDRNPNAFSRAVISSGVGALVAYPLDTIRRCIYFGVGESKQTRKQPDRYKLTTVARHLVELNNGRGVFELWRGASSIVVGYACLTAIAFLAIDNTLMRLLVLTNTQQMVITEKKKDLPGLSDSGQNPGAGPRTD